MVDFDCGFLTQENADTFPILICRDNRHGQTGATCCERKGPTAHFIPLLVDFIKNVGFSRGPMSMTMEQVVTQLQQEQFTHRAQVAEESGLADAVRAINNLATAQVRKDAPSLIDVKGLGRPKEFTGREEDFQQWSKKTEAFFAGVIKESEMMLEWAAEKTTEIQQRPSDLNSCRLRRTRSEEYKIWSLCCSRCTQHLWLSRVMRRTTLSPTRG